MTETFATNFATPAPNPSPQVRREHALRRGACPGLSAPMQTGDGLLVRLLPIGTIPLAAFAGLCAAALKFGNGIVEITARGSIQVRGLDAASAPRFAGAVDALDIAAQDGIPIHTNPLAGLDADEILDAGKLAAELRSALARSNLSARLSPKVSVTIDGGGALSLDELPADVRLRAQPVDGDVVLGVSLAGDAAGATDLGFVSPADAVESAKRLLEVIAQYGGGVRARNILAGEGVASFQQAFTPWAKDVDGRCKPGHDMAGSGREIFGAHRLHDGSFAYGLGVAFGHADAISLKNLTEVVAAAGAVGMRPAPGRTLIVIGLPGESLPGFVGVAERLGFIVRGDDPRRFVIACAGAPDCASAHIATRAIAQHIAVVSTAFLGKSGMVHLSGCSKGCAHPAPTALTVVGTPAGAALVYGGTARDPPSEVVAPDQLTAAIAHAVGKSRHESRDV